jgi:hypothetical protein
MLNQLFGKRNSSVSNELRVAVTAALAELNVIITERKIPLKVSEDSLYLPF